MKKCNHKFEVTISKKEEIQTYKTIRIEVPIIFCKKCGIFLENKTIIK